MRRLTEIGDKSKHNGGSFIVGDWTVEPDLDQIVRGDEQKMLRPQVMKLLVYLARQDGQLCHFEDLIEDLWPNKVVSDATLYNCVSELRHHLDDNPDSTSSIQTIPKKGYRLIGEIHLTNGSGDDATNNVKHPRNRKIVIGGIGLALVVAAIFAVSTSDNPLSTRPVITGYKKISQSTIVLPPVSSPLRMSVDDSRLYFMQFLDGELTPSQLLLSGGEAMRLELPLGDSDSISGINGMTPDRSKFLVEHYPDLRIGRWAPELWTVPIVGGMPRRLGKGRQGVFSPSGDQLLFMKDSVNMFIANSDMTQARKIATLQNRVYWPQFSPDGKRVHFSQFADQFSATLWELRLDGSEPKQLLQDWEMKSPCCGSWTPDGKYYIFQAKVDSGTQLWAIENLEDSAGGADFSEPFQLTSGIIDFLRPAISADGKTIYAIGWQLRGELGGYNAETDSFQPVPGLESMSVEQVSYSRDRTTVAYVVYPDGTLWSKKLDSGRSLQLTAEPMQAAGPAWSPDGSKIAFTGWIPGEPYKIYVVPATGGNPIQISNGDADSSSPSWSSDGKRLVFSDAGSDQLQVHDLTVATTTNMPGTEGARSPVWSPDGKSIAARSETGLIVYDVDSQESTVLLENDRYTSVYWSENSDVLFLVDSFVFGRDRFAYHLNIAERKLSKIARVGTLRITWGTIGQWVGFRPDGIPILLRDQSIHNIYALDWQVN